MGAVLGRVAAAVALAALLASPAAAQYWGDPVTEDEARVFIADFLEDLRRCNEREVGRHFLPGTSVYVYHADGREEVLVPSDPAYVRGYCNPYRTNPLKTTKQDWGSVRFAQNGLAMTVTWESALGGQGLEKRGPPKVAFTDWFTLVKDGHLIRISAAGWQARDLVPGGEEEYFTRLYEGGASYQLKKFYRGVASGVSGFYDKLKQRLSKSKTTAE